MTITKQELIQGPNQLLSERKNVQGSNISYLRPVQVRTIPLTYGSNRGIMPSIKLNGIPIEYESQLERDFYRLLDHDPNCIDFQPQPWKITYKDENGRDRSVFPDCWAVFDDGMQYLFDIKPDSKYQKLVQDPDWKLRNKAIRETCKKMGWLYQVVTDLRINCVRLNNIKDLLNAAKFFHPSNLDKDIGSFNSRLKSMMKDNNMKIEEIVEYLTPLVPLNRAEVISLLKYKIYNFHLYIDWNIPLSESPISLQKHLPIPVYQLPEIQESNQDEHYSVDIKTSAIKLVSNENEKEFEERYNLIKPIIGKYGKEAKKSEIKEYCTKNNTPFYRTYRWYLIWKNERKVGLYPKRGGKHAKTHAEDERVEKVIEDSINTWNNGEWTQIKSAYDEFEHKCRKMGIAPVSYETFRKRIRELPASEKRGKYKPSTQSFINRGLKSTYLEARNPCSVIQMDDTILDIRCVDSFTKQDYGRVHCTIGVDAFSRSIWGFYLSFESPSQESVTRAILIGLSHKEKTDTWKEFESSLISNGLDPNQFHYSCAGYPTILQVDNGKNFQAESVKQFCLDLNITLESRPVRMPEYGGFIESIWDTINDEIRNSKLPGRVYSRPKSREQCKRPKFIKPPGYDARKTSEWTIDQFGRWLFTYIVTKYSSDTRARQNHSPDETWEDGLEGVRFQPIGGALLIMNENTRDKLVYMSKISANCIISNRGLRYKNIFYTSDWFTDARKKRILEDGEVINFKVSHLDIRYAWLINPKTRGIEVLEAYNYDGDDRIKNFLLKGVGKLKGYRSFPISLKMIQHAKKMIGKNNSNKTDSKSIMDIVVTEISEKGKVGKKNRRFIQSLSKSDKGREKIELAGIVAQMDENQPHSESNILPTLEKKEKKNRKNWFEGIDNEEIDSLPTTWNEAKKDLLFSNDLEGEE
ncbi:MAG: TnsA endonuclease N-terminal domain-containing protein [Candidatus Hodarchaeota archaeon]